MKLVAIQGNAEVVKGLKKGVGNKEQHLESRMMWKRNRGCDK
jgi:hypothetical protein